jgi:hypothetical protein
VTLLLDIPVSCDGTWQKRGHQSLYGIQAAISSDTKKVLDYAIQSKVCKECQIHSGWDRSTEANQKWKVVININATSTTMHHGIIWWPKYGAREIWCRSLEKHNLHRRLRQLMSQRTLGSQALWRY